MTEGNNPIDRSKLGQAKRHILTDKKGIPLSTVITSAASTHEVKVVKYVIDNSVLNRRPSESSYTKKKKRWLYYHLCLDRTYSSKSIENEIIKRGYIPHISYKRKRGQKKEMVHQQKHQTIKNKRWVILERTNS